MGYNRTCSEKPWKEMKKGGSTYIGQDPLIQTLRFPSKPKNWIGLVEGFSTNILTKPSYSNNKQIYYYPVQHRFYSSVFNITPHPGKKRDNINNNNNTDSNRSSNTDKDNNNNSNGTKTTGSGSSFLVGSTILALIAVTAVQQQLDYNNTNEDKDDLSSSKKSSDESGSRGEGEQPILPTRTNPQG